MLVRKTFHPEDHKFDVWSTDEWPPKDPLGIYERTYLYCAHGRKQNEEKPFFLLFVSVVKKGTKSFALSGDK